MAVTTPDAVPGAAPVDTYPTFSEAVRVRWKVGLNSFGGLELRRVRKGTI